MITAAHAQRALETLGIAPQDLLERYDALSPAEQVELEEILTAELTTHGVPDNYLAWLPSSLPANWTAYAPHFPLIADNLDAVTRKEVTRLAVHLPPRSGKTELLTVRYSTYHLLRNPKDNVLITGYNATFAKKLSRMSRKVAKQFGILDPNKQAADEWHTTEGGLLMSRGVGSPPTGVGFNLIIIDDPIKSREDAESENYREKCWDWYTDDLYTRLEPGGIIILVSTLWHEDDVNARAVASEPHLWCIVKVPALAEPTEEEPDPLGRAEGEVIWPERFDREAVLAIKALMVQNEGERSWNALYQCRPLAREGSFFHPDKIKIIDGPLPPIRRLLRIWDFAATKDGGDWTVGLLLGLDINGGIGILDMVRGQYDTDKRRSIVRATAETDGQNVGIIIPLDPAAAGKDVAVDTVRLLIGYNVKIKSISGAKELRAFAGSAQVNAGNVWAVNAKWLPVLKSEFRAFPAGKNDDIVDTFSDGVTELGGVVNIISSSSVTTIQPTGSPSVMSQMPMSERMPFNNRGEFIPPPRR